MPLTQQELGKRLRVARENCGLTQQHVADSLEIPRTAVAKLESGERAVSSLELGKLARLYGRDVSEFVGDEEFEPDPVVALFRATPGIADSPAIAGNLRKCAHLSREATRLEESLGLPRSPVLSVHYSLVPPSNRWDGVCQGRALAEQERRRLGLGDSPVWELPETIRSQGVRVTEYDMPGDISGLFLHGRTLGLVIIVNKTHPRSRRLFSYAHEYCHLLVDRDRPGVVSRADNRNELVEVRANVFSAHFLMPESGVRSVLQMLGKEPSSRASQRVFDGGYSSDRVNEAEPGRARARAVDGGQEIQVHDVLKLAHHFGVSYEAALYHLLNLRVIDENRFEALKAQEGLAADLRTAMGLTVWEKESHWTLTDQLLSLGLEAYKRGVISRSKLIELANKAEALPEDTLRVLSALEASNAAVEAVVPER